MTDLLLVIIGLLTIIAIFLGLGLWMVVDIHRMHRRPDDELPDFPISARGERQ